MIRTLTGIVLDGSGTMPHYPQRPTLARGEHATLIIQTVTTVSPTAQQLVGMPIPVPSYSVRPYFFGGAWRFQQYERAKAVFTNTAQATVTWPDFASRPLEVRAGAPRVTSGSALVVI